MIVLITANFLSNSKMHSYSDDAWQLRARLIIKGRRRDTTMESRRSTFIDDEKNLNPRYSYLSRRNIARREHILSNRNNPPPRSVCRPSFRPNLHPAIIVRPYVLARKTEAAYKRKRRGNPKAATRNLMTFNMQRQTIILTFAPARNYLKILNRVAALLPGERETDSPSSSSFLPFSFSLSLFARLLCAKF